MVTIPAAELHAVVYAIFHAAGASPAVAQRIADALVESNLVGHDSHGVLRVPEYVERIQSGALQLHGAVKLVHETAATALIDCQWNLGQVALPQGMELAMAKARTTVACRRRVRGKRHASAAAAMSRTAGKRRLMILKADAPVADGSFESNPDHPTSSRPTPVPTVEVPFVSNETNEWKLAARLAPLRNIS